MPTEICPKTQCTGCAACFNVCPKDSIRMVSDIEGFLRPVIDLSSCNDCGACKCTCPILRSYDHKHTFIPKVYACWNKDVAIRFQSSSGGAFSAFAGHVLDNGGVVFGAAFDENMRLYHIAVNRKEELGRLRSSKYIQSDVGRVYAEVRNLLRQNIRVLFSGTPCQVAAINSFIGKDNENLLTCDMLCHGVPSPGLFDRYVRWLEGRFQAKLVSINMRHKRKGWNLASTVAYFSNGRECVLTGYEDSFMYGFINCFSLRPACYQCPHTKVRREGDVTLGDFWGIGEFAPFNHSTRNGISLILVNSEKGRQMLDESSIHLCLEERTLEEAKFNRTKLSHPFSEPKRRKYFFADYQQLGYNELAKKHLLDKGMKGVVKRILPRTWIFYLKKHIKIV